MMKKSKIIIVLIMLILITGCTKNDNNRVNILNWSSYIPDEVIEKFERESGIHVNYTTYSSNEELLAKVTASKKGTYDVVFPSDYMVELMKNRNLLEQVDTSKLYNYRNLDKDYLGNYFDIYNNYSVPFLMAVPVLAYDSSVYNNINSFNDLLNPKYKNDIVLIDDQRLVIGMGLLATGHDMNSVNDTDLEDATNYLLKLKPNIKAYDSDSPKSFLITDEADIAFLWNAEAAIAMEENPNIKVVYPTDGVALSMDNMTILKGSKNIDNAYKFIDFILRSDVMKEIIDGYPYKNLNMETDKLLDKKYINNYASNVPKSVIRNGIFVKNIGEDIRKYDKIWTKIK